AAGLPLKRVQDSGKSLTLNARAVGALPLRYQWLFNGVQIAAATDSLLTLSDLNANQSGTYSVIASNSFGSTIITNTFLQVPNTIPIITLQPSNHFSLVAGEAAFQIAADGAEPLNYQWFFNGAELPGATNPLLRLSF